VMKLMLLLAAGLICYSRIVLGVHFLSDVLAGAATAAACLPVAVAAANIIYKRRKVTVEKLNVLAKRFAVLLLALAVLLPFL